jgi:hypothetical protein
MMISSSARPATEAEGPLPSFRAPSRGWTSPLPHGLSRTTWVTGVGSVLVVFGGIDPAEFFPRRSIDRRQVWALDASASRHAGLSVELPVTSCATIDTTSAAGFSRLSARPQRWSAAGHRNPTTTMLLPKLMARPPMLAAKTAGIVASWAWFAWDPWVSGTALTASVSPNWDMIVTCRRRAMRTARPGEQRVRLTAAPARPHGAGRETQSGRPSTARMVTAIRPFL